MFRSSTSETLSRATEHKMSTSCEQTTCDAKTLIILHSNIFQSFHWFYWVSSGMRMQSGNPEWPSQKHSKEKAKECSWSCNWIDLLWQLPITHSQFSRCSWCLPYDALALLHRLYQMWPSRASEPSLTSTCDASMLSSTISLTSSGLGRVSRHAQELTNYLHQVLPGMRENECKGDFFCAFPSELVVV